MFLLFEYMICIKFSFEFFFKGFFIAIQMGYSILFLEKILLYNKKV